MAVYCRKCRLVRVYRRGNLCDACRPKCGGCGMPMRRDGNRTHCYGCKPQKDDCGREPSEEEVERMVAEQYANLPDWWERE